MNLIMPTIEAHPASGKEVMAMDDIDVDVVVVVCGVSITFTSVSCATRRAMGSVEAWRGQGNHRKDELA